MALPLQNLVDLHQICKSGNVLDKHNAQIILHIVKTKRKFVDFSGKNAMIYPDPL